LRANETAALAAAIIIAGSFPEIASFAARVAGGLPDAPKPPSGVKRRRHGNGGREGKMLKRDDKLAALIQETPAITIAAMSRRLKAAPNTVRAGLERLEIAGLIEREGKSWRVAEPRPPVETAKWTAPVSAQRRRIETEEHEHA
jgi:hypothetical protein